jgi:hypothetical protein
MRTPFDGNISEIYLVMARGNVQLSLFFGVSSPYLQGYLAVGGKKKPKDCQEADPSINMRLIIMAALK